MEKKYKKILIIGHSFSETNGLGITLTNLFKDWPKECLAIAAPKVDIDFCEHHRPCKIYFSYNKSINETGNNQESTAFLKKIKKSIKGILKPVVNKTGIRELGISKIEVSKELINIIDEFQPDFLFTCLGTLNSIKHIDKILSIKTIPLAIYIVDDWQNTRFENRFFSSLWRKKYNQEFRNLLNKASLCFSICQTMSDSYLKSYGRIFKPYHNPIEEKLWEQALKKRVSNEVVSILYIGKINRETQRPIEDMCRAINEMNNENINIKFNIFTPDNIETILNKTNQYSNCYFNKSIPNKQIPDLLCSHDILYLPLGFSSASTRYTKLSMPTKLTEYLISETPILLYCPPQIALWHYAVEKKFAYICDKEGAQFLKASLIELYNNKVLKENLSIRQRETAKEHYAEKIREKFRHEFF